MLLWPLELWAFIVLLFITGLKEVKACIPLDILSGEVKWRGVKRKSTKPNKVQYALSFQNELAITKLGKQKGYTAEKIKTKLDLKVSSRTIHRFLKRKGFVREYGYYRRPRFQETIHMHAKNAKTIGYLQMDVKYITPELSGLPWVYFEYAVLDSFPDTKRR